MVRPFYIKGQTLCCKRSDLFAGFPAFESRHPRRLGRALARLDLRSTGGSGAAVRAHHAHKFGSNEGFGRAGRRNGLFSQRHELRERTRLVHVAQMQDGRRRLHLRPSELCRERGRIHLRRRGAGRVLLLRGARAPRGLVQHSDGRAGAGIRVEPAAGKTVVAVGRGPDGLHLRPFAEKHRAEPHPCGAFFDGDFIVAAHAH